MNCSRQPDPNNKTNEFMKKSILLFAFICLPLSLVFAQKNSKHIVNLSGNSYVVSERSGARITDKGLTKWSGEDSKINTYIYFSKPQIIAVSLKGVVEEGSSKIRLSVNNQSNLMELSEGSFAKSVGEFVVEEAGYLVFTLEGISRTGDEFANIQSLIVEANDDAMVYVHDFSDYFARRGPSVHLNFEMPKDTVEWFYNEITVPKGNDVIGSYFMANGFGEGYFGIQVNSTTERRVLFSVWSPFDTQDPELIPDSLRIEMLRRGEGVHIGEFGNEGSGGQSYLRYNWKAENTYRFLTQIKPTGNGSTVYTSYFYAVDENRWRLIASFMRPETDTYYKRAHSFLENFIPEQGYLTRKVYFGNQWYRTKSGKWTAGKKASFSYDATARKRVRIDYKGGYDQDENKFFLQNCGFFSDSTPFGTPFILQPETEAPVIDFELLENL